MKFNPKSLKSFFNFIRQSPIDDMAVNAVKNNADDIAMGALNAVDDIPAENVIKNFELPNWSDDRTVRLGHNYLDSLGNLYGYSDLPSFPVDELVISQPEGFPSDRVLARPHANTALGRYFQNLDTHRNLNSIALDEYYRDNLSPYSTAPVTPKEFVDYTKRRLNDISLGNPVSPIEFMRNDIYNDRYNRYSTQRPVPPVYDWNDDYLPF